MRSTKGIRVVFAAFAVHLLLQPDAQAEIRCVTVTTGAKAVRYTMRIYLCVKPDGTGAETHDVSAQLGSGGWLVPANSSLTKYFDVPCGEGKHVAGFQSAFAWTNIPPGSVTINGRARLPEGTPLGTQTSKLACAKDPGFGLGPPDTIYTCPDDKGEITACFTPIDFETCECSDEFPPIEGVDYEIAGTELEILLGPGQPADLATGPDDNTDAYLRIGSDAFGSWTDTTFGGLGDTFNPVGATPARAATFAQAFSIYRQSAGEQEILSTSEDLQGICGEDGTMTRTLTATGEPIDTNDDGVPDTRVSSFDVTSDGMDVSFQLTQHVELGTALGGDPVALVHLDLVISNNGPPVDFILHRHQDYDMVWAGDFLDDSVGTGTNDAKGDLFVYQGEAGDPGTHITLSSPQGDVYYGGKQNVVPPNPGGCGACVAYGFGSDLQICDNPDGPGTPCCWKNHIAGIGHNTDGDSGAAVGDDAFIGMEIPISLASEGVTEVSVLLTYGAKVPGGAEVLPCPWDLDDNGSVGATDLLSLLVNWGPYKPCPPFKPADFDENCTVGATDLLALLVNWGPCP